jgi:hypothetical protein
MYLPDGHALHDGEPGTAYLPALHTSVQEDASSMPSPAVVVPPSHTWQLAAPGVELNLPRGQGMHVALSTPASMYVPAAQSSHVPLDAYCPALQVLSW